jgi:hypothetical protein
MTNAPVIMDVFHNSDFIFNNSYQFSDRYKGEEDFFAVKNNRYERGMQPIWETNFIPDIKSARLDSMTVKGAGVEITQFEVSGNGLIGHISGWPEGRYHKAHYHGAGAVLLGLESSGYVLLWSKELGTMPFQNGREDEVVKMEWKEGSVYCPPNGDRSTGIPKIRVALTFPFVARKEDLGEGRRPVVATRSVINDTHPHHISE